MKINWLKVQTVLGTWGRAFVASVIAAYLSGLHDPKLILNAALASILPVILRYLNQNDSFPNVQK